MEKSKKPNKALSKYGLNTERVEKEQQALKETTAFKKVDSFIMDLARKPEFIKVVSSFRKKFEIPVNGFEYPENYSQFEEITYKRDEDYINEISKLANNYGVSAYYDFFESYLLFGNTNAVVDFMDTAFNVVEIIDVKLALSAVDAGFESDANFETYHLKTISKTSPIGIMVHPYMSQRDIIDAIKKLYKLQIEPIQKKYRKEIVKLGVVRKKSDRVEKRNKFIYENRLMPIKELVTAVNNKFGDLLDYTYLYKIIKQMRARK